MDVVVDGFAFEWTLFWNELIKVKFNSPEADAVLYVYERERNETIVWKMAIGNLIFLQ